MPCQACNWGWGSGRSEGMKYGEGRLQCGDQYGAIEIARGCQYPRPAFGVCIYVTYPMAKVLQSEAGARAVMGSKIVLAERCSEVEGSKRMMLPWAFPFPRISNWSGRRAQQPLGTHQKQRFHSSSTPLRESARTMQSEPLRHR
jgi:hypothetical protein